MSKNYQKGKAITCPYGCCKWRDKRRVSRYLRRVAKQELRKMQ